MVFKKSFRIDPRVYWSVGQLGFCFVLFCFFYLCGQFVNLCIIGNRRHCEVYWGSHTTHLGSMTLAGIKGAMKVPVFVILVPARKASIPEEINLGLTLLTVRWRAGILLQSFWTRSMYNSMIIFFFIINEEIRKPWRTSRSQLSIGL